MNRVLLINTTKAPTRAELVSSERRTGELMFARFPSLRFAGYTIATNRGKLAANWIIPSDIFEEFKGFAETTDCASYDIAVFTDGKTPHGGQTEVRIV